MFRRFLWLLLPLVAYLFYHNCTNNFFVFDDFVWLYKAKTLSSTPLQIFKPEVIYFAPLVHFVFWVNYTLNILDFFYYHILDIAFHSINTIILFFLVRSYSKDEMLAFFSSLLFATTFVTVDAVVWPSARVDTISVMFSLISIFLFLKYARADKRWAFLCSIACYLLALGAKGTPVVVPIILAYLLHENGSLKCTYRALLPYGFITFFYFVVLKIALGKEGKVINTAGGVNYENFVMSLNELFIPETMMTMSQYSALAITGCIILTVFIVSSNQQIKRAKMFGLFFLVVGILPMLAIPDFRLCTSVKKSLVYLFASPSHRVYLSSAGMAIFLGSFVRGMQLKLSSHRNAYSKALFWATLVVFLAFNYSQVQKRESMWGLLCNNMEREMGFLIENERDIHSGGVIGMVGMTGSRGVWDPMFNVYFGADQLIFLNFSDYKNDNYEHPEILSRALYGAFFVRGDHKAYNLSDPFRQLLLTIVRTHLATDLREKETLIREYKARLADFRQKVDNLNP